VPVLDVGCLARYGVVLNFGVVGWRAHM
jgi:hypothetical protein